MGTITVKQKRNAITYDTGFKAKLTAKRMRAASNDSVVVSVENNISHGNFSIYITQGEIKVWIDACKNKSTATRKEIEINGWIEL